MSSTDPLVMAVVCYLRIATSNQRHGRVLCGSWEGPLWGMGGSCVGHGRVLCGAWEGPLALHLALVVSAKREKSSITSYLCGILQLKEIRVHTCLLHHDFFF